MTRRELLLAVLAAAEGAQYTPVQIQKALFLLSKNMPELVGNGPKFNFVPYDYGPFDIEVYNEANMLKAQGLANISPSGSGGRWNTYAVSPSGLEKGKRILEKLPTAKLSYIKRVSVWVLSLDFGSLVKSIYDAYPEMKVNSIFRG
jgi:hypothetical protein